MVGLPMEIRLAEASGYFKNTQFEEKRHIKKYKGAKIVSQGVKNPKVIFDAKWNKKSGNFRAKPHPAEVPTWEKELKKNGRELKQGFEPGMVKHNFNLSTREGESGTSLIFRTTCLQNKFQFNDA